MTRLLTAGWTAVLVLCTAAIAGPVEDGIGALDAGEYRAAYAAFLKGAKAGNAEAQVQLATMLIDGVGVRRDRPLAAQWLKKAADGGHVYAMYRLGTLFDEGVAGKPDPSAAAQWYERAVQRRDPSAAYWLARLYDQGRGVVVNPERALALYRDAASGGLPEAEHILGLRLAQKRAGPHDLIEGMTWLELALRNGDGDVTDELKKLRATLTAAQQAVVKSRVEAHLRTSPHH